MFENFLQLNMMKATIALKKLVLNPDAKITDILRHAYAIAASLDIQDFENWCRSELNGYDNSEGTSLPSYRHIGGTLHSMNILNGKHHILNSEGITHALREGITFFQEFISKNQNTFDLILPTDTQKFLKKTINSNSDYLSIYQKIDRASFVAVLETVRTMVLEFAIDLEKKGVFGEEWEFTLQEKLMTQNFTYNISNVSNMANHNESSTINQELTSTANVITGDFNSLASNLRTYGVDDFDIRELQTILDATPVPQSEKEYQTDLKEWMKKMFGKSLDGSWQIGAGAAGTILASGIQNYFGLIG